MGTGELIALVLGLIILILFIMMVRDKVGVLTRPWQK